MKRRVLSRFVIAGFMVASLSHCGGGSPSTPTPRAGSATYKAIDNPPIGMMDVTVEWANTSNRIDVYATDGRCPGFPNLQAGQCTVLARAEGVGKPKRLTFSNTAANSVYNFWLYNAGTTTESGALEVGITT